MEKIRLETVGRTSEILIGGWAEPEFRQAVTGTLTSSGRVLVVTDRNVAAARKVLLAELPGTVEVLPPGESEKNFQTLERILNAAVAAGCDRSSRFVALGGGVVGDLTGFAAAVFMRGIGVVQIPTTLLAMVDSSVGGKTAVDLASGKNLAGAFWQPELVAIDPEGLSTLPLRELRNGLAEVVKYGVILDAALFARLEEAGAKLLTPDPELYAPLIRRCCELKAAVVAADERENGRRAILNYGHTFGHAVELLSNFAISHGEGVAIGMTLAARCSVLSGRWSAAEAARQTALLRALGLPTALPRTCSAATMLAAMLHDKKTRGGQLTLVLPRAVGEVELVRDLPEEVLLRALEPGDE